MNSLFQQLMGTKAKNPLPNSVRSMVQNFKMLSNPQKYIQQAIENNPQLKSVLEASNGNYEQAFRNMAKQMNVDPDEIISMLK